MAHHTSTHVSEGHKRLMKAAKIGGGAYLGYSAALGAHYDYKTTKAAAKSVHGFVKSGGVQKMGKSIGAKATNAAGVVSKWAKGGGMKAAHGAAAGIGNVAGAAHGVASTAFNAVKNNAGKFAKAGGAMAG